jgi:hypothetical protein
MQMKEKAKLDNSVFSESEIEEKAKDDLEFAEQIRVARQVMEKYAETLQRLADS